MIVDNYAKLEVFIDRVISGTINLLIIQSEAGLAKTTLIRDKLMGIKHYEVNSHITPLMNYIQLFDHKDQIIWYDDLSFLFTSKASIAILKQVADTSENKRICWLTTSEAIGDIPQEFFTSSKVIISCNSIEGDNPHIKAIKDRSFHLIFRPLRQEIIKKMHEISLNYPFLEDSEKEEVLNIIKQNSINIKSLSLRHLIKGFQLYQYKKLKGIDWKQDFFNELDINEKLVKLNELLIKYDNDLDRLKEWDWSRQTFYSYKKIIENV